MKRDQLLDAVKKVESEGLLPSGQGEKVGARLAELLFPPRDTARSAAAIIAWLGGILVAAAVMGFVAANWDEIGKTAKLVLIFGTIGGLHFAGYRLAESPGHRPALGHALTGAAMLAFGGAIGLIAQIYNLSSHYPNAILAWWVLCVPFAVLTGLRKLLLIPLALFLVWIHLHTGVWLEEHVRRGHIFFSEEQMVAFAFLELGIAAALAGVAAACRATRCERFAAPLALIGRFAGFAGLFMLSFDFLVPSEWADPQRTQLLAPERVAAIGGSLTPFAWLAIAALVFALAAVGRRRTSQARSELEDAGGALASAALLAGALLLLPPGMAVVSNLLVLALVIALVFRGIARQRAADVNVAVLAFLVTAMARYFEWVGKHGEPFFVFLGAGVLLLALGSFLERSRRRWVARAIGSSS